MASEHQHGDEILPVEVNGDRQDADAVLHDELVRQIAARIDNDSNAHVPLRPRRRPRIDPALRTP